MYEMPAYLCGADLVSLSKIPKLLAFGVSIAWYGTLAKKEIRNGWMIGRLTRMLLCVI